VRVAHISQQSIRRAGSLLGLIFYALDFEHRRIVRRNLRFAYPHATPTHLRQTARGVFQSVAVTILEMLRMLCWSPRDLQQQVRVEGEEHLRRALNAGARAYVAKGDTARNLPRILRDVLDGWVLISPRAAE